MEKHHLAALSWAETSDMDKENQTIILPLGSIEQQGTHNPLGVDLFIAEHMAHTVAKEAGAIVGPALPLGYSEWFLDYPGTISLKMETLTQVLREYCACLVHHGFRKILFFNGHGGNTPAVNLVAREFCNAHPVKFAMVEIWKVADSLAKDIPVLEENSVRHAGEIMTSVMLHLDADIVDMDKAKPEYLKSSNPDFNTKSTLGPAEFKGIEINLYEQAKTLTISGVMGNPLAATSAKGSVLIDRLQSYLVDLVRHF